MFRRLFKRGKPDPATPTIIVARLRDRAQPVDRGEIYEDPLDRSLSAHRWGRVIGGGTQMSASGEVEFCDVEIELDEITDEIIDAIVEKLEVLGAPRGSEILMPDDLPSRPFGTTEGLAVYLNGTDLPASTYQEWDANFVYSELDRLLDGIGRIHSHWQGPTETALYAYGRSFETMRSALTPFLQSYPLCERARVVQIA